MEKRGFYIKKDSESGETLLFIEVEQFKKYLEANSNGKSWLKFKIFKSKNESFGLNIKLINNELE